MGVNRVTKRGKRRIEVRKRWPDGSTFRRYYSNKTIAKHMLARLEESIVTGTWPELKDELTGKLEAQRPITIEQFSDIFLEDYVKPRSRSWKRYELTLRQFNRQLGNVPLEQFTRQKLHGWVKRRVQEVRPATVNRDIAAIKAMFRRAFEWGYLEHHPLTLFPLLPVRQKAHRILEVEEFRHLVDSMPNITIAAYLAVLGETGMRKQEALYLKWTHIDFRTRMVTAEYTKNNRLRSIPLSDYAIGWLNKLVQYVTCPYVFVNPKTGERWVNPEKAFERGREKAELEWVGFHDLRRFRATQWGRLGVDLKTIQELLGHADIQTTMRYVGFVDSAMDDVRRAQEREAQNAECLENGRQMGDTKESRSQGSF